MRSIISFGAALVLLVGCSSSDSGTNDQTDSGGSVDSTSGGGDTGGKTDSTTGTDTGTKSDSSSGGDTAKSDTSTGGDTSPGGDTPLPTGTAPVLNGCKIFPDDNPWNMPIDTLPLSTATYTIPTGHLHADWGTFTEEYGIPWTAGTSSPVKINFVGYPGESDKLACSDGSDFCYPIPTTGVPIEGGTGASTGSDRHVLRIDTAGAPDNCTLYELYDAQNPPDSSGGWTASNGAIFHLGSNALRPDGWTSADAAGLPVLPGLVKYDEVVAGEIRHAMRFTLGNSYNGYIHPATHAAGSTSHTEYPPMGLRLRLKKGKTDSLSGLSTEAKVILHAMEKYGVILADNGSNWYISGDTNDGWSSIIDGINAAFGVVTGGDFEVVDTGPVSTAGL